MSDSEVFQEAMNKLINLKMMFKKERMHSDTVTEKEYELMDKGFDYIYKQISRADLTSKDKDFLNNNYLDVICERSLTAEQITNISPKYIGKYVEHRMVKDADFMNELLTELDTSGKISKYFAYSDDYYNAKHMDMVNLSEIALINFCDERISETQYADTMMTILQKCQKVLHKNNADRTQRNGCENVMDDICRSNIKLSSYPKLEQAYINLEEECINHYSRTLKSKRGDVELSLQNSKINEERR